MDNSYIKIFIVALFLSFTVTGIYSNEIKASNKLSAGAAEDNWSTLFILKDYLDLYLFPEELISYEFACPPGVVIKEKLKLREEGQVEPLTYQLTDIVEVSGYLQSATIHFRTGLDKGETKQFFLEYDPAYDPVFSDGVMITDMDHDAHTAVIKADEQQVKVQYGNWTPNASVSSVNPPIIDISRSYQSWVGKGSFIGNGTVESVNTSIEEEGPLFIKYAVEYRFLDGRIYKVVLTVEKGEKHIVVDEYFENFSTADNLYFKFSYKEGIDPDGRLAMSNNGMYSERSGSYSEGISENGELPYDLGIFGYNCKVPRSTVFYKDQGDNAIVFSLCKLNQWKTSVKYVWAMYQKPENMYFYDKDNDKYMQMKLCGKERHWALSVIPRTEVKIASQHADPGYYKYEEWYARPDMSGWNDQMKAGGPDARLFQKLGAYSLDWVKDLVFEWESEDLEACFLDYNNEDYGISFDNFLSSNNWPDELFWGSVDWRSRWQSPERYADAMLYGAKSMGRTRWQLYAAYAASRKDWTPEQRLKIRSWIIHMVAMNMFLDDNLPHQSMMAGHPNFYIESVYPGVFAGIFPNHPYSQIFKTKYREILHEFLHVYQRKGDESVNTKPGRYTENIICYSFASLAGVLRNAQGFSQLDGSYILNDMYFQQWMDWHMNALITAAEKGENGLILTPPIGAHAREGTWEDLYLTAKFMSGHEDELGKNLLWCVTGGKEGVQPVLKSKTYEDYGVIMRHDMGGSREAYVTMEQLGSAESIPGYELMGSMNYRWGDGGGVVYYAANGKNWSWNRAEENGDDYDAKKTTSFVVNGQNLGKRETETAVYDFDFVQYFKSTESLDNYKSRSLMMLDDRYLAIYDDVSNSSTEGVFYWHNRESVVKTEYFDNPDLTGKVKEEKKYYRFPVQRNPYGSENSMENIWGDVPFTDYENFSVVWTAKLEAKWNSITFSQRLGNGDKGKLYINDEVIMEGGDGAAVTKNLVVGEEYEFRYEYVHTTGYSRACLYWDDDPNAQPDRSGYLEGEYLTLYHDMPYIHTVKGSDTGEKGNGDQLHIVEPRIESEQEVVQKSYGAQVNDEHILMTDEDQNISDGWVQFTGKAGYATLNKLAIFNGSRAGYEDFVLTLSNTQIGASAQLIDNDHIKGRITGASEGNIKITVPSGFNKNNKELHLIKHNSLDIVTLEAEGDTFSFNVNRTLNDWYYTKYSIVPIGTIPDTIPEQAYEKSADLAIMLTNPSSDTVLLNPDSIHLTAWVQADSCQIYKVEFYNGSTLIGSDMDSVYEYQWLNPEKKVHQVWAKAMATNGKYNVSDTTIIIVSDGAPRVTLKSPMDGSRHFVIDSIPVVAEAIDYDGKIDSVRFFANNSHIGTSISEPYQIRSEFSDAGNFEITAIAYDNSGRSTKSALVHIDVEGYLDPGNPGHTRKGLIYEYYEGSWYRLPNFSTTHVITIDTSRNFDISHRQRETDFAFRFKGYVYIGQKGKYTFYATSNDGVRLSLENRTVIEKDGLNLSEEISGTVLLKQGYYEIGLDMFNNSGNDSLIISYEGPDISKQQIPDSLLFRSAGTPPTVSIMNPDKDTVYNVGDEIYFKLDVNDADNDVKRIVLWDDTIPLHEITDLHNFAISIDSLAGGKHKIVAIAYDLGGKTGMSDTLEIIVNVPPQIHFLSPANYQEFISLDTIRTLVNIMDLVDIHKVEFYINNKLTKTLDQSPWIMDVSGLDRGTYYIEVSAVDEYGLQSSAKVQVNILNTPPQVEIIEPKDGNVFPIGETIDLKAEVSDPDEDVYKVAFFEDNRQIGDNANMLYESTVDNLPPGPHTITAKAFDKEGAITVSDSVTFIISDATGIEMSSDEPSVSIYPNPVDKGAVYLEAKGLLKTVSRHELIITDVMGRNIYHRLFYTGEYLLHIIPVERFQGKGIYIVTLKTEKEIVKKTLIVI